MVQFTTNIISASEFYKVYNLLKRNRFTTKKLITVSGDGVLKPSIINVKIYCVVIFVF